MRFGLCCKFFKEPIKYRTAQVKHSAKLNISERIEKISELCLHNSESLLKSIKYCKQNDIGSFRVTSDLFPLKSHPDFTYEISSLPQGKNILQILLECKKFSKDNDIRLTIHPGQFTILNSPKKEVVENSIKELIYHAELAEIIGIDVINIHGGGGYGDKKSSLLRFQENFNKLPNIIKERLTIENDDRTYTPSDLIPISKKLNIPFVYDIHHHRCNNDGISEEETFKSTIETWNNKEPLLHISSPKFGWGNNKKNSHHDYIDLRDFPTYIIKHRITIDIEAKAKELAISKLKNQLFQ